jgi:hypothetical protein
MYVNRKMITIGTVPGMQEGGDKRKGWGGWVQVWYYLIYCKNFCQYHNVPPPSTIKKNFFSKLKINNIINII